MFSQEFLGILGLCEQLKGSCSREEIIHKYAQRLLQKWTRILTSSTRGAFAQGWGWGAQGKPAAVLNCA